MCAGSAPVGTMRCEPDALRGALRRPGRDSQNVSILVSLPYKSHCLLASRICLLAGKQQQYPISLSLPLSPSPSLFKHQVPQPTCQPPYQPQQPRAMHVGTPPPPPQDQSSWASSCKTPTALQFGAPPPPQLALQLSPQQLVLYTQTHTHTCIYYKHTHTHTYIHSITYVSSLTVGPFDSYSRFLSPTLIYIRRQTPTPPQTSLTIMRRYRLSRYRVLRVLV